MVHTVIRVRIHGSQILQMNLAQPTLQVLTHPQVDREFIGRKLAVSRKNSQDKTQDFVDGRPQGLKEEHESNDGRWRYGGIIEPERSIEILGGIALREKVKGGPEVDLCDSKVSERVAKLPMSKFMP